MRVRPLRLEKFWNWSQRRTKQFSWCPCTILWELTTKVHHFLLFTAHWQTFLHLLQRENSQQKSVFCQLSHVEISVMLLLNWPTTFLLLCHFASLDRTRDSFVSDVGVIVYNNEKLIYFLIFHFPLGYLDNPCSTQIRVCQCVCTC